MRRIYLALGVYVALFTAAEGGLGYGLVRGLVPGTWRQFHLIAGIFLAIFICLVHSLVFIHLLGTGLGVKKAIEQLNLDPAPKADLYRFKMRAFPPAFFCMVLAIITAVLGGAALSRSSGSTPHLWFALALLLANVVTFPVVAAALGDNEVVLRRVEAQAEAAGAAASGRGGGGEGAEVA